MRCEVVKEENLAARPDRPASLFFGLGQFSRSIIWSVTDLLIGYHLVERLGLSGDVAGAVLFATIAFSALPDIFVATWIGRRPNPASFTLGLQAISGIAALASALLLFSPAPSGEISRIAYICAVSVVFRISYAIYDVSQNALISLLPQNRDEVSTYVTNKILMTSIGRLAASALVFMALSAPGDDLADLKAMSFAIVPVLLSALGLSRVRAPRLQEKRSIVRFTWISLPWSKLAVPMIATGFQIAFLQIIVRLLPLFGSGRPDFADSSSLVVAFVCGTVAGPVLAHARNWPLTRCIPMAFALSAVAMVSGITLLFPHAAMACLALAFVHGAVISGLTNLVWERMALIVADHAAETGVRIDAPAFALLTTSIKLALAISSGLFGVVLDGFKHGDHGSLGLVAGAVLLGGTGTSLILAIDDLKGPFAFLRPRMSPRSASKPFYKTGVSS